jgi:hypothetical protein
VLSMTEKHWRSLKGSFCSSSPSSLCIKSSRYFTFQFAFRFRHNINRDFQFSFLQRTSLAAEMFLHRLPMVLLMLLPLAAANVSTVTMTATSAPQATSSQYTSDKVFQKAILDAHNFFRMEHNATALTWNDTSAKYAAKWAGRCNFEHSVSCRILFPWELFEDYLLL